MGHFYSSDGSPQYTVIGANGKERDSTLADARKHGWVASVTTIMAEAAAPGLDIYKQQQLLDACLALPMKLDMPESLWRKKVVEMSKEHAKKAAARGNEIHDALEQYYKTGEIKTNSTFDRKIVEYVVKFMEQQFPGVEWISEASFANPMGFGGKVDLHSKTHNIVLDFKTKDKSKTEFEKVQAYDAHGIQTAAYVVGLNLGPPDDTMLPIVNEQRYVDFTSAKRYNLFISTKEPGVMKLTESTDFMRDWDMFRCLLSYWKLRNKI